jgi:hypothetical protein
VQQELDPWLTVAQAAERARVTPATWRSSVTRGWAPPPDDPGDESQAANRRNPRWRRSTVDAYIQRRKPYPRRPAPDEA